MSQTLVGKIQEWAERKPKTPALHGKRDGAWFHLTWETYWERVQALGRALIELGVEHAESIAILGKNEPEWVQAQFGAQAIGAIPAPIYGTSTLEQTAYILKDCGAKVIVCGGREELEKVLECEAKGLIAPPAHLLSFVELGHADPRVSSLEALIARGRGLDPAAFEARFAALDGETIALLIYTSGTTGKPKGVQIDHGGQLLIGEGGRDFAPQLYGRVGGRDPVEYHAISYLPLSHQAEQIVTNVFSLMVGGQVYFCPEIAQVRDFLTEVRPTIFLGVPRVWEKFEAALRARLGEAKGARGMLAAWAMQTELRCFDQQVARGVRAEAHLPITRRLARKLVIDKIKSALGLDRLQIAATGSAPISKETQRFFASLGICIYEVYGLTETSGVATITDPLRPAFGTVGKPFRGVDIRIGEESEIQIRGRNVVRGYQNDVEPIALTSDGWLRTGDAGAIDRAGNVAITGRLKELLITAGGKNVAPVELEFYLQSIVGVGQAVVVGDRKPYLSALITLDPENLEALSRAAGTQLAPMSALAADPKVRSYLEREIEAKCNQQVARYQTIKRFAILPRELSIDAGELTASMKLRRPQITQAFSEEIAALYA